MKKQFKINCKIVAALTLLSLVLFAPQRANATNSSIEGIELTLDSLVYYIPIGNVYTGLPQGIGTVSLVNNAGFDGEILVYYNGDTTTPVNANTYAITVEIKDGTGYDDALISLGNYVIGKRVLNDTDFVIVALSPSVEYNGFPQKLYDTIEFIANVLNFDGKITVIYEGNYTGYKDTAPPTNADFYDLLVHVEGGGNYASVDTFPLSHQHFNISPKVLTDSNLKYTIPDNSAYTGCPISDITVDTNSTVKDFDGNIQIWYYRTDGNSVIYDTMIPPTEAGDYFVSFYIVDGDNYETVMIHLDTVPNYTISKKTLSSSDFDAVPSRTYNGLPQGIDNIRLNGCFKLDSGYTIKYDNDIIVPTDAATYDVTIEILGDNNYEAVAEIHLSYIIAQKTPEASDFDYQIPTGHVPSSSKHGMDTISLKSKFTGVGDTIIFKYDGDTTTPTTSGTYSVTIDINKGKNFDSITNLFLDYYTIGKEKPTAINFDTIPKNRIYNGNPQAVNIRDSINGIGKVTVKYNGSTTVPTDAENYEIKVDVTEGATYGADTGIILGIYTIAKKTPTAADYIADLTSKVYNGTPQGVTITEKIGLLTGFGDTIIIKYAGNTTAPTNVANYSITADITEGKNFKAVSGLSFGTYSITIRTIHDTDLYIPTGRIYNGLPQPLEKDTIAKNGIKITSIGYGNTVDTNFTPINAGTYAYTIVIIGGTNHSGRTFMGYYSIAKKPVTVQADDKTVKQGDPLPATTITYIGFIAPDSASSAMSTQATAKYTVLNSDVRGTSDIVFETLAVLNNDGDNYTLLYDTGTLSVIKTTPTPINFDTIPTDRIYNGNPQPIVITGKNGVGIVSVPKYNGDTTAPVNAGDYIITVDILEGTEFGEDTGVFVGIYTIAKKLPTAADFVPAIPANHIYDGLQHKIDTVITQIGLDGIGDTITIKYNGDVALPVNAGNYSITVDITAGRNYSAATGITVGTYPIAKKTPTAADLIFSSQTKAYNGFQQNSDTVMLASGMTGLGVINFKYNSGTAPKNVGTYKISIDIATGTNFEAATGIELDTLFITPISLTAQANDTSIVVGSTLPVPSVSYIGFVGNDTKDNALSTQAAARLNVPNSNTVGVSLIDFATYAVLNNQNYTLSHLDGELTIIRKTTTADKFKPLPTNCVYNGFPQPVVVTSIAGVTGLGDTIIVKYDGDTTAPINAATYLVTIDISKGTDYEAESGIVLGNYTIAKKTLTDDDLICNIPANHIYSGSRQGIDTVKPKINILNFDGKIILKYNGDTAIPINAGNYPISVEILEGNNYSAVSSISFNNYIIAKKSLIFTDLTFNIPANHIYNGMKQGIDTVKTDISILNFDGKIIVKYSGDTALPINAGNYQVSVEILEGNNYDAVTEIILDNYNISKKTPTIADLVFNIPTNHVYNGSPQGIGTVSLKNDFTGLGTITIKYNDTDTTPTNAGTYSVSIDIAEGTNYTSIDSLFLDDYSISKRITKIEDLEYSIPTDHIYNGNPQGITAVTVKAYMANFDADIIVKYNNDETKPVNAGTYAVTVDIVDGISYSDVQGIVLGNYSIAKKGVTITANDTTIKEGDELPIPVVTYAGFISPDNEDNALIVKAVAKLNVSSSSVFGTSIIDFATTAVLNSTNGANYTLLHDDGTLTILRNVGINNISQQNRLNAYVNNGTLYVSGLTAGDTWSVYSISGALIHKAIATGDAEEITLSACGTYIILSGNSAIKTVYFSF